MTATIDTALAPVRAALAAHARQQGERRLAEMEATTAAERAAAVAEAEQIRVDARAAGAADAATFAAAERGRVDRDAREEVLRAQREEYDSLAHAARSATAALRLSPDYPRLRQILVDFAHAVLGPEAVIVDQDSGGIVGTVAGRRVDLSLPRFAERALESVLAAQPSLLDGTVDGEP